MRGKVILHAIERGGGSEDTEYGDVSEWCFYDIQTHGGDISIEFRLDHNGYYGGSLDFGSFIPTVEPLR